MPDHGANRGRSLLSDFLIHIHPRTVPVETIRFSLSLGLGGMAVTLLCVLFVTGLFQLLMYSPGTDTAYQSIQLMYSEIPLGGWIRNIHFWAGNLLVIVAFLHLLRVFLTGALGDGRQLNWIIGLVLLFLVLFANFSGYLLPWDQLAFWAVTIFTGMFGYIPLCGNWLMQLLRGGNEVGAFTLANFYAIHVGIIPFCFVVFSVWHFWLIRKAGGLVQAERSDTTNIIRVPAVPDLISREAAVGFGLVGALLLFASVFDAPLAEPANPAMSPNPAKAAWYFLGLQELLMHLHPTIVILVIPVLCLVVLVLLPYKKSAVLPAGKWFGGAGERLKFIAGLGGGAGVTFFLVFLDDKLIHAADSQQGAANIWMRGFIPLLVLILSLLAVHQLLSRKWKISQPGVVLALAGIIIGIILSLTITGIWFRGPGMQLVLPIG
jgi:quinol-cytochrome oxidoreductase complex cytochrome b subunit